MLKRPCVSRGLRRFPFDLKPLKYPHKMRASVNPTINGFK